MSVSVRSTYTQAVGRAFSDLMPDGPLRIRMSATWLMGICAPEGVGIRTRLKSDTSSRSSRA